MINLSQRQLQAVLQTAKVAATADQLCCFKLEVREDTRRLHSGTGPAKAYWVEGSITVRTVNGEEKQMEF